MKAIYLEHFGGPEVLLHGERPTPEPADDQVLIEVHAAGVNPRDWMLREGTYFARRLVGGPPIIPGSDVSGVVAEVGAKVTGFRVGDPVVAMQSILGRMGGYAEYIAVKEGCVAHKPAGVSHVAAAALPVAGLTAWQALFEIAKVGSGAVMTVVGAAGGVGHLAVQLGRWAGVDMVGVCGPENLDFVRGLGARLVVDRRAENFLDVVSAQDLVFDTIGRERFGKVIRVLTPHGVQITTVPTPAALAEGLLARLRGGPRLATVLVKPRQADLTSLLQLTAAGDLRPEIAGVYPLADAAEAQRVSRTFRTRGKLVLSVRS
ncbi:MAG TPA: NADP-dependent oxidoreductase [Solirubrobacteraceae bacterium]|nr:NADP-dependent oxidoreductase [Solirubrobacteraceae bacterium]